MKLKQAYYCALVLCVAIGCGEDVKPTDTDNAYEGRISIIKAPSGIYATPHGPFVIDFTCEDDCRYDCRINEYDWENCIPPVTYTDVLSGVNTFNVRAVEKYGVASSVVAEVKWTVNTDPDLTAWYGTVPDTNSPYCLYEGFTGGALTPFRCDFTGNSIPRPHGYDADYNFAGPITPVTLTDGTLNSGLGIVFQPVSAQPVSFVTARDACENSDFAGVDDWHLATEWEWHFVGAYGDYSALPDPAYGVQGVGYVWVSGERTDDMSQAKIFSPGPTPFKFVPKDNLFHYGCTRRTTKFSNSPRFVVSKDARTFRDNRTGLTWTSSTRMARGGSSENNNNFRGWIIEAVAFCDDRDDEVGSDWRLPTIKELHSIYAAYRPDGVDASIPGSYTGLYLSSTITPTDNFYKGAVAHIDNMGHITSRYATESGGYVRCVRGPD